MWNFKSNNMSSCFSSLKATVVIITKEMAKLVSQLTACLNIIWNANISPGHPDYVAYLSVFCLCACIYHIFAIAVVFKV